MERYFLGSNTAYGFVGNYERELKNKKRVYLMKGGPGTGKSTILKKIAHEAKRRGMDFELWYCSGDSNSLDGVYIKDLNIAVIDATSPHAVGADLPIIKDEIFDLASSLQRDKLIKDEVEIKRLLDIKKHHFIRVYQHLKSALCHYNAMMELESEWVNEKSIRAYASYFGADLRSKNKGEGRERRVFIQPICPSGESEFFDCLRDKKIYKVSGCEKSKRIFFDELAGVCSADTYLLSSLDPNDIDGILFEDIAIVSDAGHFDSLKCESVNLGVYEKKTYVEDVEEEKNSMLVQIAFATQHLNGAREAHLNAEKYFVGAMNFANNDKIYNELTRKIFE